MTSQGSPQSRLKRALATGNPLLVRAAAAELPHVGLDDGLAICLVLLDSEPGRYQPAAVPVPRAAGARAARAHPRGRRAGGPVARGASERGKGVEAALGLAELCEDAGLQRAANALRRRPAGA